MIISNVRCQTLVAQNVKKTVFGGLFVCQKACLFCLLSNVAAFARRINPWDELQTGIKCQYVVCFENLGTSVSRNLVLDECLSVPGDMTVNVKCDNSSRF